MELSYWIKKRSRRTRTPRGIFCQRRWGERAPGARRRLVSVRPPPPRSPPSARSRSAPCRRLAFARSGGGSLARIGPESAAEERPTSDEGWRRGGGRTIGSVNTSIRLRLRRKGRQWGRKKQTQRRASGEGKQRFRLPFEYRV